MDETDKSETPAESKPSPWTRFRHLLPTPVKVSAAIAVVLLLLLSIVALFLYLFYRPEAMQVAVEAASLARLAPDSHTPTPCLSLKLSLAAAVCNPNNLAGIQYDGLELDAFYNDELFGWTALPAFSQKEKYTDTVTASMQGNTYAPVERLKMELVDVDVRLVGRVRYKIGAVATKWRSLRVECPLRCQLVTTTGSENVVDNYFQSVNCNVVDY